MAQRSIADKLILAASTRIIKDYDLSAKTKAAHEAPSLFSTRWQLEL